MTVHCDYVEDTDGAVSFALRGDDEELNAVVGASRGLGWCDFHGDQLLVWLERNDADREELAQELRRAAKIVNVPLRFQTADR